MNKRELIRIIANDIGVTAKISLGVALILFVIISILRISTPFVFAAIVSSATDESDFVFYFITLYAALFFAIRVSEEMRLFVYVDFEQKLQKVLTLHILRHFSLISFENIRRKGMIEYANIVDRGLDGLRSLLYSFVFSIAPLFIEFIALIVIVWIKVNYLLAFVVAISLVIFGYMTVKISGRIDRLQRVWYRTASENFKIMSESLKSNEMIRSLNQTTWSINRNKIAIDKFIGQVKKSLGPGVYMGVLQGLIIFGLVTLSFLIVMNQSSHLSEAIPTLILVNGLLLQIVNPMLQFAGSYRQFVQGLSSGAELIDMLSAPQVGERVALTLSEVRGFLLRDVSIDIEGKTILDNINCSISGQGLTLMVGPSGSGKSLIGRTLAGLQEYRGKISTGFDVKRIFYISQSPEVFDIDLFENVYLGNSGDASSINRALIDSGFQPEEIEMLSNRPLGEEGRNMSGGQRARLGVARALLRDADALILDEPTSALDQQAAERLRTLIANLSHRLKVVVITHDQSFISHADQIIRIQNETIVRQFN